LGAAAFAAEGFAAGFAAADLAAGDFASATRTGFFEEAFPAAVLAERFFFGAVFFGVGMRQI
jgi:hypothetical protein